MRRHKYISRPLDMLKGRARVTHERQRPWQRGQEPQSGDGHRDDPRVCPPAIPGQMTLIRPRRHLTIQHEQRIRHRQVRGYERVESIIAAHAAAQGLGKAWRLAVGRMVRLALAIRDADGDELAGTDAVSDLPIFAAMVIEILRRADLPQPDTTLAERRRHLASRAMPCPPRPIPTPRSCGSCQSWGFDSTCEPCRRWARGYDDGRRAVGRCGRCHRGHRIARQRLQHRPIAMLHTPRRLGTPANGLNSHGPINDCQTCPGTVVSDIFRTLTRTTQPRPGRPGPGHAVRPAT
jgi:hypothetical protein